jgi:hypothetical protein
MDREEPKISDSVIELKLAKKEMNFSDLIMPIYDHFSLIFKNSVIVNSNIKFYFMSGDSRLSWRLFLHGGMMPFDIFYV